MSTHTPKADALVSTALKLFAANGYHAVGVDRIKAESGVAKMTLYKHFQTKEVLIEKVLERRDHDMQAALTDAISAHRTPLARLKAIFDWHAQWFSQPAFNGCMFIKATEEFPDDDSAIREVSRTHKLWLRDLLESELRQAKAQEPVLLAGHLLVVLDGLIVNANLFRGVNVVGPTWGYVASLLPRPASRSK